MMDRRGFLGVVLAAMGGAAAGASLERVDPCIPLGSPADVPDPMSIQTLQMAGDTWTGGNGNSTVTISGCNGSAQTEAIICNDNDNRGMITYMGGVQATFT